MRRVCRQVQEHLPDHVEGTLPRLRRRLLTLHVRGCEACAAELERQRAVHEGLARMGGRDVAPPEGLLDALLEQAASPGIAGRAAVPARGAVSGARPVLSVALLLAGAVAGSGVGWVSWQGARVARRRMGQR